MRILTALTYYRPHVSGLTIYAERLARAFARRGHQVTILTTQMDPSLPLEEIADGVQIVRVPVLARISKGAIAPAFGWFATRLVPQHDIVHLHLPQFDAPGIALRARALGKPAVITYHCDLKLPDTPFNRFVDRVVMGMNHAAGLLASRIITYTQDYADHSPYLNRYAQKVTPILPPVELPAPDPQAVAAFAHKHAVTTHRPVIGVAARFAAEKGIEVLLDALPQILARYPRAQVLYAGMHQDVLGELSYAARLMPRIRQYELSGNWRFLGVLDPVQMAAYYPNIDVLTVPSLNSTESFGLVQIEAMMNGVPCVPSALPGVRQPVGMHGMGVVSEIGNPGSLAAAILEVLDNRDQYRGNPAQIREIYRPDRIAQDYEDLFDRLLRGKNAQ